MEMETREGQINCIYAGGTKFSDQLEAILEASKKPVLAKDITKAMPSDTQWHDMAERLDTSLKTFINTEDVKDFENEADYDEESLVKILAQQPKTMKGAILVEDDHIKHITRYTEALEFFNVDSAGLEKTFHTEDPTTQSQTKDDKFI